MKRKLFILLLIALFTITTQAQKCGTVQVIEHTKEIDKKSTKRLVQNELFTQRKIREKAYNGSVITIPVVVHVLYTNSANNISNTQIQSQINVLNRDFRRTNSDRSNKWSQAADARIEFCLAKTDPNGNATNGITRKQTSVNTWNSNQERMKRNGTGGVNPWNQNLYLNIWLVPNITSPEGDLLGYAYYPGANPSMDGVVIKTNAFGSTGYVQWPNNKGRTATHEIGHYLNLVHIWGDGGCGIDDFVSDTPPSDAPNQGGCPTNHSSCGSLDMVENYMDYTDDSCMNLFTQGQVNRMRVQLLTGGIRARLGASDRCNTPSTDGNNGDICNGVSNYVGGTNYPIGSLVIYNGRLRKRTTTGWQDLGACGTSGNGNSNSCSGVPQYQSGTNYPIGSTVIYNGRLRKRTTTGWQDLGACSTSGNGNNNNNGCSGVPHYQSGVVYNPGDKVTNNNMLYQMQTNGTWKNLGACSNGRTVQNKTDEIQLYPNPAKEILFVNKSTLNTLSYTLYDISGRYIKGGKIDNNSIQVKSLQKGFYILQIIDGNETFIKKFVKN